MSREAALDRDAMEMTFTQEEAALVVEGLRTLLNARRFAFKEPQEEMRNLHGQLFNLLERVESQVKQSFRK